MARVKQVAHQGKVEVITQLKDKDRKWSLIKP